MNMLIGILSFISITIGIYVVIGSINGLHKIKELERKMKNGK